MEKLLQKVKSKSWLSNLNHSFSRLKLLISFANLKLPMYKLYLVQLKELQQHSLLIYFYNNCKVKLETVSKIGNRKKQTMHGGSFSITMLLIKRKFSHE